MEVPGPERPLAIGLYGISMGFASIVAQLLGGLLVTMDLFGRSWRLIFLVNIPIGLITALVLLSHRCPAMRIAHQATYG